ncbi:hypothetical protein WG900_09475 [Novosphingobium sp. AS3R-12]|uniref:Uncharacterized protein n=1 Tax=Novosphingobium aquae TaxID=3133435 RepID=A0ABU8S9J6_9SPHN
MSRLGSAEGSPPACATLRIRAASSRASSSVSLLTLFQRNIIPDVRTITQGAGFNGTKPEVTALTAHLHPQNPKPAASGLDQKIQATAVSIPPRLGLLYELGG